MICLIVYSIHLYITNEENKSCFFPKLDNFNKKEKAVYIHAEEVIRTSDSIKKEKAINTINENIKNFFFNRIILNNSNAITKEAFIISVQKAEKSLYRKIDEYFRKNKIQYGNFNGGELKVFFEKHPYLRKIIRVSFHSKW